MISDADHARHFRNFTRRRPGSLSESDGDVPRDTPAPVPAQADLAVKQAVGLGVGG